MYGIVNHFEGWLLVVVVHLAVAMQDGHALLLGPFTVAPVLAVIRPVVPLAGKCEETFWNTAREALKKVTHAAMMKFEK